MSSRYHVNLDGLPGICSAAEGRCPYGKEHYATFEMAQAAADTINARQAEVDKILGNLDRRKVGPLAQLRSETYQILELAYQEIGNPDSYFLKDGRYYNKFGDEIKNQRTLKKIKRISEKVLEKVYPDRDIDEVSIDSIHLDPDDDDHGIIQSGGYNVLDGAVFNAGKITVIEAKHTGGKIGARMFKTSLLSKNLKLDVHTSDDKLNEILDEVNLKDIGSGLNYLCDRGDTITPLVHFIDGYRKRGADGILYSDRRKVSKIFKIPSDSEITSREIAEDCYDQGLRADIAVHYSETAHHLERRGVEKHDLPEELQKPFSSDTIRFNRFTEKIKQVEIDGSNPVFESLCYGPYCLTKEGVEKYNRGEKVSSKHLLIRTTHLEGIIVFAPNAESIPNTRRKEKRRSDDGKGKSRTT